MYRLIVQYILGRRIETVLSLAMNIAGNSEILFRSNGKLPYARTRECTENCFTHFRHDTVNNFFLNAGLYDVKITSTIANSQFLLVSIISSH